MYLEPFNTVHDEVLPSATISATATFEQNKDLN